MDNKISIPVVESPELVDSVLYQFQIGLKDNLPWLDFAFGKAQKITRKIGQKVIIFPACYAGKNEYKDVSPDGNIGNFSFFMVNDPEIIEWIPNQLGSLTTQFSLIIWIDLRKIHPKNYDERNTEAVKADVMRALNLYIKLTEGRFSFNRIWERAENIYREFPGVLEIDNQFMMHPFAGFRFDGTLTIQQNC